MKTRVRLLRRSDHDVVFEMMADPEAVAMAAFTADDPTDRAAFDEHMERVLANRGGDYWAVTDGDGTLIGTIATFPSDDGNPEVTYWIARPHWGQGHASRALALVLEQTGRPVLARVALDNLGSRRVLEKAGFDVVGSNHDYAPGRNAETEELVFRLS
jgi:RimJ/RimL family protein N-acetyltransferase